MKYYDPENRMITDSLSFVKNDGSARNNRHFVKNGER